MNSLVILKSKEVKVLQVLIKSPHSVQEVCNITKIPVATCYRIIKKLVIVKWVSHIDQLIAKSYTKIYRSTKSKYTIQITSSNIILLLK